MPDDFDIDVEALASGAEPAAEEVPAPTPAEAAAAPAEKPAPRFMSARKPDLLHRAAGKVAAPLARVKLPTWNLRTFVYLFLLLLLLWFLLENWTPARVNLLLWSTEAPKTVLFILNLLIGAALLRWWQAYATQRYSRRLEPTELEAPLDDEEEA